MAANFPTGLKPRALKPSTLKPSTLKPNPLKPSLIIGGSQNTNRKPQDTLYPTLDSTPKTNEIGLQGLSTDNSQGSLALVPVQSRSLSMGDMRSLATVSSSSLDEAPSSNSNVQNMVSAAAGNILSPSKSTIAAPQSTSLTSHQMMQSNIPTFNENMRKLRNSVIKYADDHAQEIATENKLLSETLNNFVKKSFEAVDDFMKLYKQLGTNQNFDQEYIDRAAQKNLMMKQIIEAYYLITNQLADADDKMSSSKFNKYKNSIDCLFNSKMKDVQALMTMVDASRQQDMHEMKHQIEHQTASLKEEAQRYAQFFSLLEQAEKIEQNDRQHLLELEKQRSEFMLKHEECKMQYEKDRAESIQKSELETQKLNQQQEVEKLKLDVQFKTLELQDEQVKVRLGAEERIQLANMAVQEVINQKIQEAELKKEELKQSGETTRAVIAEVGKIAVPAITPSSCAIS